MLDIGRSGRFTYHRTPSLRLCVKRLNFSLMKLVLLTIFLLASSSVSTNAQSCLTQDDVTQMLARVETSATPNKKLKEELLKLANRQRELLLKVVSNDQAKTSDQQKLHKLFESHTVRLCEILKTSGWPTTALVDRARSSFDHQSKGPGNAHTSRLLRPVKSMDQKRRRRPVCLVCRLGRGSG